MTDESTQSERIEALVQEFIDRKQRGEAPTIAEYCSKYPDLAEKIHYVFPTLLMMEDLKPDLDTPQTDHAVPAGLERIGDYRILGEIGRGGMGVVYEAEQESLSRRVALKVLAKCFSRDDSGLVRFQREARAAAQMHHTNIVPVFEIGQESGYIFYAMQLIQGQGLDRVIKDLMCLRADSGARKTSPPSKAFPSESTSMPDSQESAGLRSDALARSLMTGQFRAEALMAPAPVLRRMGLRTDDDDNSNKPGDSAASTMLSPGTDLTTTGSSSRKYYRSVAKIGRQVAEALVYSHARGVIHRDIKPSNLLLDAAGVVWITDFGIAKSGDQDITQAGDIVGTVRYMPPERFKGHSDELSDIYALGLTLYELAVLKPAFDSTDRLELIERIKQSEPAVPRSIDPHMPIDLETIILKAIEKEPASRYPSAGDLAEDLRRFIEDEPIMARRISLPGRLARWARRSKKLAVSLSAVAMLIIILIVGSLHSTYYYHRQQHVQAELRSVAEDRSKSIQQNLYFAEMNVAGQAAAEPYGADTVKARLSRWLPQKAGVDLRGWEWYYLYSLVHRERFLSERLGAWTWSIDFSPDGKQFAAAVNGFGFKIWDTATGRLILEKETGSMRSVAFSPDGTRLATTGFAGTANVWRVSDGEEVLQLKGHTSREVNSVAWSPDGTRLATCSELAGEAGEDHKHMLRVWDAATGEEIRKLDGHAESVKAVQWSPDGARLASASYDGTARIWDPATGEELIRFDTPLGYAGGQHQAAVCWSPDGSKLVSAGSDGAIRVWDVATKEEITTINVGVVGIHCINWRPDTTQLVSAHRDGTVRLWDVEAGQELTAFLGHTDQVWCVRWSPDGSQLASASLDWTVRVWDVDIDVPTRFLHSHNEDLCLDWSRDGSRLASAQTLGGLNGAVVVLQATTGERHVVHQGLEPRAVAWSPDPDDERLAFAGRDTVVRVWDALTDKVVTLEGETTIVYSITWNHDGSRLASADEDGNVSIWNMDTNSKIATITAYEGGARSVGWTCDGTRLATAGWNEIVKVWDPATGELIWQAKTDQDEILSVRWSPDGTQLATVHNGAVVLWDGLTGAQIKTLDEIQEAFLTVDWSPDSRRLATGSKASVSVWDVASGHVALRIPTPNTIIKCVRWNRDGRRLAACGYPEPIRIYDATIGYQRHTASTAGSSTPD